MIPAVTMWRQPQTREAAMRAKEAAGLTYDFKCSIMSAADRRDEKPVRLRTDERNGL
jgi:hypothetical protein